MRYGGSLIAALILAVSGAIVPATPARAADKARITALSDVAFGTVNVGLDQSSSQNVCAYSDSATSGYSVSATGSGSGGSFALSSGAAALPYEVLWSGTANQTGGTALIAGATTGGFTSAATHQFCNSGPSTSASLTIVLRSAALGSATAGSYSGTLQVMIAPE
jgi:hypothetical protein